MCTQNIPLTERSALFFFLARYNQIDESGAPASPGGLYLNTSCDVTDPSQACQSMGGTGWQARAMSAWGKQYNVPVWLGEGAAHNGGGGPEGRTYATSLYSSFYYLDALATLARLNHAAFARQTLAGGNYELLRCSAGWDPSNTHDEVGEAAAAAPYGCDLEPRPDMYVALLWRQHMGTAVLAAPTLEPTPAKADLAPLRVNAHCWRGGTEGDGAVAFSVSNVNPSGDWFSLSFALDDDDAAKDEESGNQRGERSLGYQRSVLGATRNEYILSSANATAGLLTHDVSLNGATVPLRMSPGDARSDVPVPALEPAVRAAGDVLSVAPGTLGFVVFPQARVPACMR